MNEFDSVERPKHYNSGKYETIDIIEDSLGPGFKYYLEGNVIKYIMRFKHKGGIEDLKKTRWYIEKLIKVKESEEL